MVEGNRRIVKNTLFLYFRMLFIMIVSLYTSRVVLQVLGIDDFGIYQVVGGVVGLLSFLNSALSSGSSRFLTYELGIGDFSSLKKVFNTTLSIHILLAVVIAIIAETVGLWFVCNKLGIQPERLNIALWVYHLSVVTAIISIIQVPYNASIISHEKMDVYAYVSIVEVFLKLLIVYLLKTAVWDKLLLYALLLCIVQLVITVFYAIYCYLKFVETHYDFSLNRDSLKSILSFSGWSLFSNMSVALNSQGTTIITNMFFGPSVVTARVLSTQVNLAANQLVNNFRLAVNPQIVKRLASSDIEGSKKLLLESTKYSYYLMLLLGLPILLLAEPILNLWLETVPGYTVLFLQLVIIQSLFSVLDTSFYTALYAVGRIRENALISPLIGFLQFPIVYFLFNRGYSPLVLSYVGIICYGILAVIVKPILICRFSGYTYREVYDILLNCLIVTLYSIPIPIILYYFLNSNNILTNVLILVTSVCSVILVVWFIGINQSQRKLILNWAKKYLNK